jgi:hypothetical protein
MNIYEVRLGIDRAAVDTRRRVTLRVKAADPLSAAIEAERIADMRVREPRVEYTHAMAVRPLLQVVCGQQQAAAAVA